eukprot:6213820-Pleurochrysis_carterae.AAC.1
MQLTQITVFTHCTLDGTAVQSVHIPGQHCCAKCTHWGGANLEVRVGLGDGKTTKMKKSDVATSGCPGALPVGPCGM